MGRGLVACCRIHCYLQSFDDAFLVIVAHADLERQQNTLAFRAFRLRRRRMTTARVRRVAGGVRDRTSKLADLGA